MQWQRLNRKIHYWGAILCALPVLIIIFTGVLLLLKKDIDWIQPPTMKTQAGIPTLAYQDIFQLLQQVPGANVQNWQDIDRLDVRPGKGVIKVRTKSRWEIQLHHQTGEILQVAYRRSDLIESIHNGSFFHAQAKLWVFLPAALTLLALWITGIYLFVVMTRIKQKVRFARKVAITLNQ